MFELLFSETWPWYVAGPLIGLAVPVLALIGNYPFGVSTSLRHIVRLVLPGRKPDYFDYDIEPELWNLFLIAGLVLGGFLAALGGLPEQIGISPETQADLASLGVTNLSGLIPGAVFNLQNLLSAPGLILLVVGGFLIGFGTRYANGCTSGHSITGLSILNPVSLLATAMFFVGGLIATHLLMPLILRGFSP
ncbi:MAG: YeeE/YedE family protein [Spirochaetales bacterium]|nr:YeeE/YedE family protein [Leptospiraceae bacterium]MCP5483140.1 YeeE/YedE family protein [Spirochaetales bacterium]MCP5484580.1 YeeE/YedE family protein [Spirochaetales bacterium]